MTAPEVSAFDRPAGPSRFKNNWPVLPMRAFLAALFLFAGYAKLTYPGFFDPKSLTGLKATVDSANRTPLGGALGPLSDHPSLFGHITAFAEIAIGLGLLVGLLTRIAALGGMVLTVMIALSINWNGIKEYTASSGWFTSVDLAVAAALSVFVIGGAGPLSLDGLVGAMRRRRNSRDDGEPGFRDNELNESRARLQGGGFGEQRTDQLPTMPPPPESRPDPDPNSLWTQGRRDS
jgi:thiosulfate dehydrogenase [quinone] large subunit